jgi:hypothetical protein
MLSADAFNLWLLWAGAAAAGGGADKLWWQQQLALYSHRCSADAFHLWLLRLGLLLHCADQAVVTAA